MSSKNIVIFLGAGFSMEAHQPIMSHFGEVSEAQLWGSKNNSFYGGFKGLKKHKHYNSYSILKNSGEHFEALRKKVTSESKLIDFDPNNMEDLFTYVEMRSQCNYDSLFLKCEDIENNNGYTSNVSNKELLYKLKIWLWQIFRRVPLNRPEKWFINGKPIDPTPYNMFINSLKNYSFDNICMLSTNYDLILEFLCNKNQVGKIYYPINKNNFDFDTISHGTEGDYVARNKHKDSLLFCKLHGSVNYFEKNNDLSILKINNTLGGETGKSRNISTFPSISALDAPIRILKENNLFPAIIPPTYAKMETRTWLQNVWEKALSGLIESDKWIFIGYSFPPSDGHMRSLFNVALMEKKSRPEIVLVSPSSSILNNYYMFIEHAFKFYKQSFSEFILENNLENEISSTM